MITRKLLPFLLGPSLLLSIAHAQPAPITIESITASGSGCPDNTAAITLAPDQRSFSVLFDHAMVESSNVQNVGEAVCELTIVNKVSAGWKMSLHTNDFRGFSQVDKGSRTFQRTSYYRLTPNNRWNLVRRNQRNFKPPFNDNFIIHHEVKFPQAPREKCVDHFETVTVQVQMVSFSNSNRTTSAQMALDSFDGAITGQKQTCIPN